MATRSEAIEAAARKVLELKTMYILDDVRMDRTAFSEVWEGIEAALQPAQPDVPVDVLAERWFHANGWKALAVGGEIGWQLSGEGLPLQWDEAMSMSLLQRYDAILPLLAAAGMCPEGVQP